MSDTLECEEICTHLAKTEKVFALLLSKWDIIQEMVAVLKIPYEATVKVQKDDFTLSDFYGAWVVMQIKLKDVSQNTHSSLGTKLLVTLCERQKQLFDNITMATAMFLDPRYHTDVLEDSNLVRNVKTHLIELWHQIQNTKSAQTRNVAMENLDIANKDDDFALLDAYYLNKGIPSAKIDQEVLQINNNPPITDLDIIKQIDAYSAQVQNVRLSSRESVVRYWRMQKDMLPQLYELTKLIFCIPPSQSTVERAFSALSNVFDSSRYRLNQKRLEEILLIALNEKLFYKVTENAIAELRNKSNDEFIFGSTDNLAQIL